MRDSHGVPLCRVIRFYLARLMIDSNRWLLISYKQWLFHERSSLVISMKQMMRLDCGKMILLMLIIILIKLLWIHVLMLLMMMIYLLVNLIIFNIVETLSKIEYYSWYLKT